MSVRRRKVQARLEREAASRLPLREFWFTPSDYAPSWFVRVTADGEIEILKKQDIWPGYPGAKELPFEQGEVDRYRERILRGAGGIQP